jgi:hypothetical protein
MEINIKKIFIPTLETLAAENSLMPEQYAANIVMTFLESHYRASILDKIKIEPVENLTVLKAEPIEDLISSKSVEINPITKQ